MKKSTTLVLMFLLLCGLSSTYAQTGIDKPQYQIVTYRDCTYLGTFNIELFPLIAPLHVNNFDSLANVQFFDSTAFHRVVPGFVIQGGDPNTIHGPISTWGQGQPWQPTVPAEFSAVQHQRGILGAARDTGINSANSQFYICVAPALFLDGNYTVYGKVYNGMDIVDTIVNSPRDVNDVPLQKISMFVTYTGVNDSIPDPPTLLLPADNSINVTNLQWFKWTAVQSAVLYTLEISTDSLFSTIAFEKTVGLTQAIAMSLPGSHIYYWRVKANNGGHVSAYSPVWKFTSVTAAPPLISPIDSSVNVYLNPLMTWGTVGMADNYWLQVGTSNSFASTTLVFNQQGLTDTVQQIGGLLANTRYYWRVRSYNGTTAGYYSAKYTFLTGNTTGQAEIHHDIIGTIFPNPAAENVQLELFPENNAPVELLITDVNGRKIYREKYPISSHMRITIDVSKWENGMYFIGVVNGARISTDKLLID